MLKKQVHCMILNNKFNTKKFAEIHIYLLTDFFGP